MVKETLSLSCSGDNLRRRFHHLKNLHPLGKHVSDAQFNVYIIEYYEEQMKRLNQNLFKEQEDTTASTNLRYNRSSQYTKAYTVSLPIELFEVVIE